MWAPIQPTPATRMTTIAGMDQTRSSSWPELAQLGGQAALRLPARYYQKAQGERDHDQHDAGGVEEDQPFGGGDRALRVEHGPDPVVTRRERPGGGRLAPDRGWWWRAAVGPGGLAWRG